MHQTCEARYRELAGHASGHHSSFRREFLGGKAVTDYDGTVCVRLVLRVSSIGMMLGSIVIPIGRDPQVLYTCTTPRLASVA